MKLDKPERVLSDDEIKHVMLEAASVRAHTEQQLYQIATKIAEMRVHGLLAEAALAGGLKAFIDEDGDVAFVQAEDLWPSEDSGALHPDE